MKRALFWLHRYLGIAVGWLMLLWCLSGLVMIYVSYPRLLPAQRLAALETLRLEHCCQLPVQAFAATQRLATASVEMFDGQPLLRVQAVNGSAAAWDFSTGQRLAAASGPQALRVATAYLQARGPAHGQTQLLGLIDQDQWTILAPRAARPLYYLSANDAAGTRLYVSSTDGRLVQVTDQRQRCWNWLGSVPHWLYFRQLRQHAVLWAQMVIWSSVAGSLLAGCGLYLGLTALRSAPGRQLQSPFAGWRYWHHVPGLLFGLLLLGWVVSGLLSMNPWGWLESRQAEETAQRLGGEPATWQAMINSLRTLPTAQLPVDTVRVEATVVNSQLHFLATTRSGERRRFDAQWQAAPLSPRELQAIRHSLGEHATVEVMSHEDPYYYSHGDDPVLLPVLRVLRNDASASRDYLDPMTGELLTAVDRSARWYRWLHSGLHRMDFTPLWRTRPLWDLWMWLSLSGAALVCLTGTWLGIRRLTSGK